MANQPPPSATAIISSRYCAPATHPIDLTITKERTKDNFTVTDINGNVVLTVKSPIVTIFTPREHRFLFDANGNPILHLRRALLAANDSWEAFRGESKEPRDLIFTRIRRPLLFQLRAKLNVFLANNSTGVGDFTVKARYGQSWGWDVFIGESDTVVAQIHKKPRALFGKQKFFVTVGPNIDYAFIVALIVTLD